MRRKPNAKAISIRNCRFYTEVKLKQLYGGGVKLDIFEITYDCFEFSDVRFQSEVKMIIQVKSIGDAKSPNVIRITP